MENDRLEKQLLIAQHLFQETLLRRDYDYLKTLGISEMVQPSESTEYGLISEMLLDLLDGEEKLAKAPVQYGDYRELPYLIYSNLKDKIPEMVYINQFKESWAKEISREHLRIERNFEIWEELQDEPGYVEYNEFYDSEIDTYERDE